MDLVWLDPSNANAPFPPVHRALRDPDGLLAVGGDLSVERLMHAYQNGIFPWYEADQPILWWSPDPRGVLYLDELHISRSLRKKLRHIEQDQCWSVSIDQAFKRTMLACAAPRTYAQSTWITSDMVDAYVKLFEAGHAHSIEIWDETEQLIGGVYGVASGAIFFGESMFSTVTDSSKAAMVYLVAHLKRWGYKMIDCQLPSEHLATLGARAIPRDKFLTELDQYLALKTSDESWRTIPNLKVTE